MSQRLFSSKVRSSSAEQHDFIPFVPPPADGRENKELDSNVIQFKGNQFGLPDEFWSWVNTDADIKSALDKWIDQKASDKAHKELENYKENWIQEFRLKGYNEGLKKGAESWSTLESVLISHMREAVEESQTRIKAFEKQAHTTVISILKKCLIPFTDRLEEAVRDIVRSIENEYEVSLPIKVFLNSGLADQIQTMKSHSNEVMIAVDENLKDGECRVSWTQGEVKYSIPDLLKKIDEVVGHAV